MVRIRVATLAAAALVALAPLLVGCGGASDGEERAGADGRTAEPSPTQSSTPPYDPLPWKAPEGALGRCGPQPQRVVDARFRTIVLRDPGRATLPTVVAGSGRTVAVLLHQTDGNGWCGWLPFAEELTSRPGVTVVAPDLCGYGAARCERGYSFERQTDQVRLAVGYARERLGARRVVLVGASMGGSLAVLTAAEPGDLDAIVDLSGPSQWRDRSLPDEAAQLRVPALVAIADSEGPEEVAAARDVVAAAPEGSELLTAETGHGYELLAEPDGRPTAIAERVLAWVRSAG